jgi:GMP synthase (glutamine-hydrolysing)
MVKLASTHDVEFAAYKIERSDQMLFNTILVFHSTDGSQMLENFLVKIADAQNFTPTAFVEEWWS